MRALGGVQLEVERKLVLRERKGNNNGTHSEQALPESAQSTLALLKAVSAAGSTSLWQEVQSIRAIPHALLLPLTHDKPKAICK